MSPPPARDLRLPARRDPTVAAVARRWRALTSGRTPSGRLGRGERTLAACSGGADSSALVLALAAVTGDVVVAHVVHDLRPQPEALADRDAARSLARALGLAFVESRVSTRELLIDGAPAPTMFIGRSGDRNPEGLARRLRYLALARLAQSLDIGFVATGHHAGDQLETILLALVRGSGPRGLRGVAPSRSLRTSAGSVRIIRPMLGVAREDCERLCREARWGWREDLTNADTTRLRSYLRHKVIPSLSEARPGVERHAAASAELLRDATALVSDRAKMILAMAEVAEAPGGSLSWSRAALRAERRIVIGEVIRRGAALLAGMRGMDRLGRSALDKIIDAIRSSAAHPRRFQLRTIEVRVTSRTVMLVTRGSHAG